MNLYQKISRRFFIVAQLFLLAFVAIAAAQAQTSGVDLSFNAVPDKYATTPPNFTLQPDNKIIVFSDFQVLNGVVKSRIARLNADGSLDDSFNCTTCNFIIGNALAQLDGKIVVSGTVNSSVQAVVYRLNADGTRDTSFTSPFAPLGGTSSAVINAIQPDGKILVTLNSFLAGFTNSDLYRLNPNGTFDTTFTKINVGNGRLIQTYPVKISVLPDGKILVATNTTSAGGSDSNIRRYNADGTPDATFESPNLIGPNGSPDFDRSLINDFDVQSDGSIVIVGRFVNVNGISRRNIVKLLPTGNVDLSFDGSNIVEFTKVKILPDARILVSIGNQLYRLNTDGRVDNSFVSPTNIARIDNWMLDSAGRIVLSGVFLENGASVNRFARLDQNGSVESSFTTTFGIAASITAIGVQADGKVVFAGDFVRVNGAPRVSIARVNSDGSLDPTFTSGSSFNGTVSKILVQSDGKFLVAGSFSNYNGAARQGITRLNADGSLDTSFNPNLASGTVNTIALQADGKILIGGFFSSVNGQTRTGIARLNPEGSLDASFNPTFGTGSINSIVVQPDGKIMVGGSFSGVNGFSRARLVRLNSDGSLDASFNAGNIINNVTQIEILPDGKYLVLTGTIVRLNNNGTSDTTFQSPMISDGVINQLLVQPDGSIVIGGSFTVLNSINRSRLARLRPDGSLDASFFPTGANGTVRTIARQSDGQILVGGDFSIIGDVTRLGIARLNVSAVRAPFTPFDFDGDGRADIGVFRPSNGFWYILPSRNNAFYGFPFGQASDRIAPADYDGDGRTDVAVFRDVVPGAGISAYFYITRSLDNSFVPVQFGATGDVPVSGDFDGDGKADLAVYRGASLFLFPSYFFYRPSSQPGVDFRTIQLGTLGDKPLVGDFDGDKRLDAAVFRPSNGVWYVLKLSNNEVTQQQFGISTDIPVPADYDGDGVTNLAVFRPSNGFWYIARPTGTPAQNFDAVQFGAPGDLPVPADYDGDGRTDIAVFRPSNGAWYLLRSTQGFLGLQFGASEDRPIPNAYIR